MIHNKYNVPINQIKEKGLNQDVLMTAEKKISEVVKV